MHLGVLRKFNPTRIDHNEPRPAKRRLLDACADDRVVFCGIASANQDGGCVLDVLEGIGCGAGPEDGFHGGSGGRMAHPSAAIYVICSEDDASKLLREVVFLVRGAG